MTDAVHAKGGVIFCQIWHTGRASPPSFRNGTQPISSSDIPISGDALDGTAYADNPPRPMTTDEIQTTTREFGAAAKRALEAGFDGVEIHGRFWHTDRDLLALSLSDPQVRTVTYSISSYTTTSTHVPTPMVAQSRIELVSLLK